MGRRPSERPMDVVPSSAGPPAMGFQGAWVGARTGSFGLVFWMSLDTVWKVVGPG